MEVYYWEGETGRRGDHQRLEVLTEVIPRSAWKVSKAVTVGGDGGRVFQTPGQETEQKRSPNLFAVIRGTYNKLHRQMVVSRLVGCHLGKVSCGQTMKARRTH